MPRRSDLAENPKGSPWVLTRARRRQLMIAFMGLAGFAFVLALAGTALGGLDGATPWLVAALAILAIAVAGQIVLLVAGGGSEFDRSGEWRNWERDAEKAAAKEVILRCPGCNKTFPVKDTGERPLRTQCTHCGKTGSLKGPAPAVKR